MYQDGRGKVFHEVTDAKGRFGVDTLQGPYAGLNMFVTAAGHVPKVTSFGFGREMPSAYTMKLEPASPSAALSLILKTTPVPNTKIDFDAGGNDQWLAENIQFGTDATVVSDADGQWSCNMIPKGRSEISLHASECRSRRNQSNRSSRRRRCQQTRGHLAAGIFRSRHSRGCNRQPDSERPRPPGAPQ